MPLAAIGERTTSRIGGPDPQFRWPIEGAATAQVAAGVSACRGTPGRHGGGS
jgi:hypothetical protein